MTSSAALLDLGLVSPPTASGAGKAPETGSPETTAGSLFPDLLLSATQAVAAAGTAVFQFALPQNCASDESCGQDDAAAGDGQDTDRGMSYAVEAGLSPQFQAAPFGAVLPACQSEQATCAAETQLGEGQTTSAPGQELRADEIAGASQSGYRLPAAGLYESRAAEALWNAPPIRRPAQTPDDADTIDAPEFAEAESGPDERTVGDDPAPLSASKAWPITPDQNPEFSEPVPGVEPTGDFPRSRETALLTEEPDWIPPIYTPIDTPADSPQQITGSSQFATTEAASAPAQNVEAFSKSGVGRLVAESESATNAAPHAYGVGKPTQARATPATEDDRSSPTDPSGQIPMDDPIALGPATNPTTAPLTATVEPGSVAQAVGNQTLSVNADGRRALGDYTALRRSAAEPATTADLANAEVAFEGRVSPDALAETGEFVTEAKQTSRRTDPDMQSWALPDAGAPATEAAASDDSTAAEPVPSVTRRSPAYILHIGQSDTQSPGERATDPTASRTREPMAPEAIALNAQARPQIEPRTSTNRAATNSADGRSAALEPPLEQSRESSATRVPARDITLQLDDGDGRVQVRVVERRGEIHFAVRTPDPQLAGDLRRDLGSLSTRFEEAGLHGETWHHAASRSERSEIVSGTTAQESQQQLNGDGEQRRRQQQPQQPRDGEPKPSPKEEREEFPWFLQSLE